MFNKVTYRWVSLIYANIHCYRVSGRANGNEEEAHFLECGGMLSRRLGFHPVLRRPSSLIVNDGPDILDNKRGLLSRLTMSSPQRPIILCD